jgi:hypothetical protein
MKQYPKDSIFGMCQNSGVLFTKIKGLHIFTKGQIEVKISSQAHFNNALNCLNEAFNLTTDCSKIEQNHFVDTNEMITEQLKLEL